MSPCECPHTRSRTPWPHDGPPHTLPRVLAPPSLSQAMSRAHVGLTAFAGVCVALGTACCGLRGAMVSLRSRRELPGGAPPPQALDKGQPRSVVPGFLTPAGTWMESGLPVSKTDLLSLVFRLNGCRVPAGTGACFPTSLLAFVWVYFLCMDPAGVRATNTSPQGVLGFYLACR